MIIYQCLCDCVPWTDAIGLADAMNHEPPNTDAQALALFLSGLSFVPEKPEFTS